MVMLVAMIMTALAIMRMIMVNAVNVPKTLHGSQDQPVNHSSRRGQYPNCFKGSMIMACVRFIIFCQTVAADKFLTEIGAGLGGHTSAHDRLQWRIEHRPLSEFGLV